MDIWTRTCCNLSTLFRFLIACNSTWVLECAPGHQLQYSHYGDKEGSMLHED